MAPTAYGAAPGAHADPALRALIREFASRYGWPARAVERPLCVAHRGASAHANENTLAAFRLAARLGADMWELDARLSRDGAVVICHDDAITAADGKRMVLAAHDVADIVRVPLARGGTVPTLQGVINLAVGTGRGLYVEVKERAAVLPTLQLLSTSSVPFGAIGSFDHETVRGLTAARSKHSRLPVSVLVRVDEDPFTAAAQTGAEVIHLCWEQASNEPDHLVTPDLIARSVRERLLLDDVARRAARRARSAGHAAGCWHLH